MKQGDVARKRFEMFHGDPAKARDAEGLAAMRGGATNENVAPGVALCRAEICRRMAKSQRKKREKAETIMSGNVLTS
jgi:hypothetical protein